MLESYNINDLVIGKLITLNLVGGSFGIIPSECGPFIFNKIDTEEGRKQQYKEIITDELYQTFKESKSVNSQKFGKTYVQEIGDLIYYLNQNEMNTGIISKKRIIEISKQLRNNPIINTSKEKTRQEKKIEILKNIENNVQKYNQLQIEERIEQAVTYIKNRNIKMGRR